MKSTASDLCPAGCPGRAGDVGLGHSGGLGASQSCKKRDFSLVTFIKSTGTWSLFLGQVDKVQVKSKRQSKIKMQQIK